MKLALPVAALAAVAATAAPAASFPVEVDSQMNGLAIEAKASAGVPLVVTFVSRDKRDATCRAEVASGLDSPQERTVTVKAGKSTAIPIKLVSTPNRVRLKVSCEPRAAKR